MVSYIPIYELSEDGNRAKIFLCNYISYILAEKALNKMENYQKKENFIQIVQILDFLQKFYTEIYFDIQRKPGNFLSTPNMEEEDVWQEELDTSEYGHLNILNMASNIFNGGKSMKYVLKYYDIEEEISPVYEKIADKLQDASYQLKEYQTIDNMLDDFKEENPHLLEAIKILNSDTTRDSLKQEFENIISGTEEKIQHVKNEAPDVIKKINELLDNNDISERSMTEVSNMLSKISRKNLFFGDVFDRPGGEYGDKRERNVSIIEKEDIENFRKLLYSIEKFEIMEIVKSSIKDNFAIEISQFNESYNFVYPATSFKDDDALRIFARMLIHDIVNNQRIKEKFESNYSLYSRYIFDCRIYEYIIKNEDVIDEKFNKNAVLEKVQYKFDFLKGAYSNLKLNLTCNDIENYKKFLKRLISGIESYFSGYDFILKKDVKDWKTIDIIIESARSIYIPEEIIENFYTRDKLGAIIKDKNDSDHPCLTMVSEVTTVASGSQQFGQNMAMNNIGSV